MGTQRRGESWRARFRHPDTGREYQKTFVRRADAQRWLREQQTAIDGGSWVNPRDCQVTFASYYASWSQRQV